MDMSQMAGVIALVAVALFVIKGLFRKNPYDKVVATVREVEVSQRVRKDNDQQYTAYVPIYEYVVGGQTYTARGAVTEDPERHHVGDTREIVYNTQDPNEVHLKVVRKNKNKVGALLLVIGLIIVVVAVVSVLG